MTGRPLLVAVSLAVVGGGCFHHETVLPGVLDLRSDGRTAPAREEPLDDPYLAREGFAALIEGDGVQTLGSGVVVEDRAHYVFRFIPVYNDSSTEEVAGALGKDGALRDVSVGESFSPVDVSMATVGPAVPLVGLALCALTPPITTTVRGVRIHAGRLPFARALPPLDAQSTDPHVLDDHAPRSRDESTPHRDAASPTPDTPSTTPGDGVPAPSTPSRDEVSP